jgi:hydrogenase maturation protease
VGPKAADAIDALNLPGVHCLACALLTPELAEPVSQAQKVVFVDAAIEGSRTVEPRALAPARSSQIMAHAADPATLLALARDIYGRAPEAWLLTIPLRDSGIGEALTPETERDLQIAVREIRRLAGQSA